MNRVCLALSFTALTACVPVDQHTLTFAEEAEVFSAIRETHAADAYLGELVELSTTFTLAQGAEAAATAFQDWAESQLPCSQVTRVDSRVVLDLGGLDDACTWRGRTFAGVLSVEVVSASPEGAVLEHTWEEVTDGVTRLDGGATVTWDAAARTRRVEHDAVWSSADGLIQVGGDRVQALLDEEQGAGSGIRTDGQRWWTDSSDRSWHLDVQGVEMRGQDPVPQSGAYVVTHPTGKTGTLTFERLDSDTIAMTLAGGRAPRTIEVTAAP